MLEVGEKVTLNDGTEVEVVRIASDGIFIGRQPNGKTGIFFVSQVKRQS
jgi:hypothetical protein